MSCAMVGWALSIGLIDLPFSHWTHVTFKHYRLHSGGSGGGLETSLGGAGGGLELADIEGARSLGHGAAAVPGAARARTRRAGACALLDWDNLPGRATRLLRLE